MKNPSKKITSASSPKLFANAVIEEAGNERTLVFIQDYHLGLLPRMLKQRNPDLRIAQFWHIPWPNAETFGICPWKEEIIEGLLGSTIVGFQTPEDGRNPWRSSRQGGRSAGPVPARVPGLRCVRRTRCQEPE